MSGKLFVFLLGEREAEISKSNIEISMDKKFMHGIDRKLAQTQVPLLDAIEIQRESVGTENTAPEEREGYSENPAN